MRQIDIYFLLTIGRAAHNAPGSARFRPRSVPPAPGAFATQPAGFGPGLIFRRTRRRDCARSIPHWRRGREGARAAPARSAAGPAARIGGGRMRLREGRAESAGGRGAPACVPPGGPEPACAGGVAARPPPACRRPAPARGNHYPATAAANRRNCWTGRQS